MFILTNKIFNFLNKIYHIAQTLSNKTNYDIINPNVQKKGAIYIISYKPLFKLLLEKEMTKTQLRETVGFSTSTLAKMSKNEYVSLEIIESICLSLNCKIEEVVEIKHERNTKEKRKKKELPQI